METIFKVLFFLTLCITQSLTHGTFPGMPKRKTTTLDIKMPGARPAYADHYLCTAVPVNKGYVVGYKALAEATTAHHILLYACSTPAQYNGVWDCGSICSGKKGIMFAWAKNAPPLHLPKDVGYELGEDVGVSYVVMQIHYAHPIAADEPADTSGIQLEISKQRQKYIAGIFLMVSGQAIPSNTPVVRVDVSCKYDGPAPMYPFGFRTHAHVHSRVITGYQYNGTWHEVGKGNPQWPQAFYPVQEKVVIKPGDSLVARCIYNSSGVNHRIYMGSTASDEMCNFYMMYYTDSTSGVASGMCTTNRLRNLVKQIPKDADTTLPPNPALEDIASGHHHHHHGMTGGHGDPPNQGQGREGGTLLTPATPMAEKPSAMSGMDYYSDPYDDDYTSFDYPQRFDPRYISKFYDQTESGRGRNRNRYPYFHESEKEMLANEYAGQDMPPARKKNTSANRVPLRGGGMRSGWGAVSAKKGPPLNSRYQTTPRPAKPAPGAKLAPRKPQPRLHVPSVSETPQPIGQAVKTAVKPSGKWVHVPTTMVPAADWPLDKIIVGQVGGVSTDKEGNLYVFHRGARIWNGDSFNVVNDFLHKNDPIKENTLVKMDRNGKVLKQWGAGKFFMPHGLTVDKSGNLWLTDVALHQVLRYPPGSDEPDLVLGEKFVPGHDETHFCKPADVAVLSTGEFFVADGYCNARIVKFSKEGKFLNAWGSTSLGEPPQADGYPPTNTFHVVHSITVAEDKNMVCASDRENGRIQCYNLNGNFVKQITSPRFGEQLFGVAYSPQQEGMLFAVNGQSPYHKRLPSGDKVKAEGFSIDITTGEITGTWQPNNEQREFSFPHTIAVDNKHEEVYVGELGQKLWKFVKASSKQAKGSSTHDQVKKGDAINSDDETGHMSHHSPEAEKPKPKSNDKEESSKASIIIGALLIVPIVLMVVITVLARLHSKGKLQCCAMSKGKKPVFNYFTSHKGFDPLSTEESDHEMDPLNDSDGEDYSTTPKA